MTSASSPGSAPSASADFCPACLGARVRTDSALARQVRIDPPEALRLCVDCGLGWIAAARVVPDYEEDYFKVYEEGGSFQGGVDDLPPHLAARLVDLARLNGGRPGRLLEVGCGFGPFLAAAHDRGWQVHGTDVSHYAARRIADRYGLTIEVGDIMTVPLPNGLDVVHMNHALEHFHQPVAALARLRGSLRDGGMLYLEVPNELASLYERVRWRLLRRATPPMTAVNPHLFFFTPVALDRALRQAGFSQTTVWTERRNVDADSRLPLGRVVKRAVYALEHRVHAGPNIVAIATR